MNEQLTKNRPIKRFRDGATSVSIWKHDTQHGVFFSVNVQRAYKDDKDNEWKHTDRFSGGEILVAAKLLEMAYSWIVTQSKEDLKQ